MCSPEFQRLVEVVDWCDKYSNDDKEDILINCLVHLLNIKDIAWIIENGERTLCWKATGVFLIRKASNELP